MKSILVFTDINKNLYSRFICVKKPVLARAQLQLTRFRRCVHLFSVILPELYCIIWLRVMRFVIKLCKSCGKTYQTELTRSAVTKLYSCLNNSKSIDECILCIPHNNIYSIVDLTSNLKQLYLKVCILVVISMIMFPSWDYCR